MLGLLLVLFLLVVLGTAGPGKARPGQARRGKAGQGGARLSYYIKEVSKMAKCKCKKCGLEWASVVDKPKACPSCKSYNWQIERKR